MSTFKVNSNARITAIGTYVPKKVLSNHDLEQLVDTNDEWIVQRTGIKERRIAEEDEFTSDLCIAAIQNMVDQYDVEIEDTDLIIVATSTADFSFPSTASQIQAHFQLRNTGAIDLRAACAGFTYGLHVANGLITAGLHKKIMVIGADVLSKITNYNDRTTCILFGDGAGVVLVEKDKELPSFLSSYNGSHGEGGIHLYQKGLSNNLNGVELEKEAFLVQNGREVYKWAVNHVPKGMLRVMENTEMTLDNVDWFIPHSANLRMIESICQRSNFPLEKTLYSLVHYGNTSAATIPLSIQEGLNQNKLKNDNHLLLYGFGGGLVYAGLLIRWSANPKK
ncbi:ketoacyl-ACP synthase III [Chengkuizengella axinellae]|uniref:Beta-ketoacyl-[acyl-carrier-protein] synthase III n=1 Tax=Chengkuizengella axinellae TaxID=3064388 RepID=A0ABT9ITF1_9BACL|nr:ketoacyl-ACP synthase III [Chengkuizengella sp. 2205SS18-9]MDP5272641.1 ketoacyl-ACP synthase III [Chengkuizengella sp. 2205SS18-9]